jgi:predicted dehydrogenase
MLKIGLLGVGHLGLFHLKCIGNIPDYDLVGFYDPDIERSEKIKKEYNVHRFENIEELVDASDVVDIVTPTISHYDCAVKAIKKSKHIFIEKPIASSLKEAEHLISLSEEAGVKVQVGHVERFNPAFLTALKTLDKPMFIQADRLGTYNPRGTDVPVVLDLMIHDIDIVLSIVNANVRKVHASGVNIVSDTPDIANARLEFDNGTVANLTASRVSLKNYRKARFFQHNTYITVDFLNKETEIVRIEDAKKSDNNDLTMVLKNGNGNDKKFIFEKPDVEPLNAIEEELRSFLNSINNNTPVKVGITDGYNALKVAHQILEKINWTL